MLGTRLAVFASMPRLGLIVRRRGTRPVVQAAGGRALFGPRPGHLCAAASRCCRWCWARPRRRWKAGSAPNRAATAGSSLPRAGRRRRPADGAPARHEQRAAPASGVPPALAPAAAAAIEQRIARGEQSLLFLNRRGYAPVLFCGACGWKSGCPHCSAWRVFHKADRTLRCHHCGFTERGAARLPRMRQPGHRPRGPRHRAAGGTDRPIAAAGPCGAHRRRQHPRQGRAAGAIDGHARRRGGCAGGHADDRQGARLPRRHAGGRGQPRCGAVLPATSAPPSGCSRC